MLFLDEPTLGLRRSVQYYVVLGWKDQGCKRRLLCNEQLLSEETTFSEISTK